MSWLIQYKLEMRRSMHQASTICTSYICVQLPYWDLSRCLLCRLCFYNPMAPVLIHMCFFNIFLQFWWYWCSLLLSWFDWWNEILDLGFAINSKSGIFRDDCLNLANAEQEQFVCVFCKNKVCEPVRFDVTGRISSTWLYGRIVLTPVLELLFKGTNGSKSPKFTSPLAWIECDNAE